jgi:hypothetical protein
MLRISRAKTAPSVGTEYELHSQEISFEISPCISSSKEVFIYL